ncbi:MAG: ZPR1 zinc finger domain-containing protein [Candidatus Woesearchaeota archaeon]
MLSVLTEQECPVCKNKTLELREDEQDIPYFGKVFLMSMTCSSCMFHQADVEAFEQKEPCKYTLEVSSEEDMKIRVVKSSQATVKIPHIVTITSGPSSQGYVTNVEGILTRVKSSIELARDSEEEEEAKKRAQKLIKKLNRVMWGSEKLKIIIEDPSGNSAIISDKAVRVKL